MDAILFDVDDTLYDQRVPFEKAVRESFTYELPMEAFYRTFRKYSDDKFEDSERGVISMIEMYCYRMQSALREYGHAAGDEEVIAFQKRYFTHLNNIRLTNTMEGILTLCRDRGVTLGIITNGPCEHQKKKLRTLKAERWIPEAHWYISAEIGIRKPDPEIFRYAIQDMNLEAGCTLYIGDTFANDIEGAKTVGLHSLWFNHRHRAMPRTTIQPDGIVYSEEEMQSWICRAFRR